jgi:hypothetical protein
LTAQVYQMIYKNGSAPIKTEPKSHTHNQPKNTQDTPPKSEKAQTLINALSELKSKPIKTKQDKDSIGIIEAILKNERQQN